MTFTSSISLLRYELWNMVLLIFLFVCTVVCLMRCHSNMWMCIWCMKNESHPRDNIDSQPEITERMRAILVDWLIQVQTKFELSLETLYLTINIVDWFLAVKNVPKRELQLVGISAVQMATKYEEIYPPQVSIIICCYLYVLIALLAFSMNVKGITLILNCRFITLSSSQVGLTLMNRYWLWRKSYWPSWTGLWLCQYLWFSYFVLSRHQSQIRRCVCVCDHMC